MYVFVCCCWLVATISGVFVEPHLPDFSESEEEGTTSLKDSGSTLSISGSREGILDLSKIYSKMMTLTLNDQRYVCARMNFWILKEEKWGQNHWKSQKNQSTRSSDDR